MGNRDNPYRKPDHFTREAKERGFPARSVFKLEDIDRRARILRPGQRVLDVGAAPGSWSLFASKKIGQSGKLLAVDLSALQTALPANATFVQGDLRDLPGDTLRMYAPYDVVLSDMAPATSGTREADQARSFELFSFALELAKDVLGPGGAFVGKIFMGPDFSAAKTRLKQIFAEERTMRPEAIRGNSFELFLVGLGRRA